MLPNILCAAITQNVAYFQRVMASEYLAFESLSARHPFLIDNIEESGRQNSPEVSVA
jgi:hypothetical protein